MRPDLPSRRCGPTSRRALLGLLAMFTLVRAVWAHDAFEITTDIRILPEGMVMEVTMAQSTGQKLSGVAAPVAAPLEPHQEEVRTSLAKTASAMFVVRSKGTELKAKTVESSRTQENDLVFRLVYPVPEAGPFEITAAFLDKLPPEGYGATVTLNGPSGAFLGQKTLMQEDTKLELANFPASSTPGASPSPAAASAAVPSPSPRSTPSPPGP